MTTKYGIPCIKLPGGEHIQIGSIVRFLAGIAVILALTTGWLEWHAKLELGMWIGMALVPIYPGPNRTARHACA